MKSCCMNVVHPDTPAPRSPMFSKIAEKADECCKEHWNRIIREPTCNNAAKCRRWFDRSCCKATQSDLSEEETARLISDFEKRRVIWTMQRRLL